MMNNAINQKTLFRKIIATGLVPVLLIMVLSGCGGPKRHMPTWSRVQAVSPQTKTEVRLYKDEAPEGSRRVEGRFHSATDDFVTLTLPDGQNRTFQKQSVREFLTHRSFWKRWPGWAALGIFTIPLWLALPIRDEDPMRGLWVGAVLATPVSALFFYGSRMRGIYEVPPEYRTLPPAAKPPNAGRKPGKKPQ